MKCPLTFVGDLKDTIRDIEKIFYKITKLIKMLMRLFKTYSPFPEQTIAGGGKGHQLVLIFT